MNKIKVGLTIVFFLIISPLLLIQGQNNRFWDLSKYMRIPAIPSGIIIEKILYILFCSLIVIYTPILFIIGRIEEGLKYQYSLITFIFTVIATLLYSYLLANITLFMLNKGKIFLSKKRINENIENHEATNL